MPEKLDAQCVIDQTRSWVDGVVVGLGLCPFAKASLGTGRLHYTVSAATDVAACMHTVVDECLYLDEHKQLESSLVIYPRVFFAFQDYLDGLALAEELLDKQGYRGVYQIAGFHPQYCFANEPERDAANYTNRSPYPMFHVIRESSMEQALRAYPDPDAIPQRNIAVTRKLGRAKMQQMLDACKLPAADSHGNAR